MLRLSINAPRRIHYHVDPNGKDELLFQIDSQQFRLHNPSSDPDPIYFSQKGEVTLEHDDSEEDDGKFAYERDLQNFLAKNLSLIEPGLSLYFEEEISGIEFPVGKRFIDILAVDINNSYVVTELKVSCGYDRAVGQILRYMACIRKSMRKKVRKYEA